MRVAAEPGRSRARKGPGQFREETFSGGRREMKGAYRADFLKIGRKELVEEVRKFLLGGDSAGNFSAVPDNIVSPGFGSSDLMFFDRGKTEVTVVRINLGRDCEKFLVASISYYFWLKDFLAVNQSLFGTKCGLKMCLFSPDFSPARHLLEHLASDLKIHPVRYTVLRVDGLEEPAIYFHRLPLSRPTPEVRRPAEPREKPRAAAAGREKLLNSLRISREELSEFDRLRELHLPGLV